MTPLTRRRRTIVWLLATVVAFAVAVPVSAQEPVKIGLSMALTGAYALNGKAALVAMQMWVDEKNETGGLLGRPVKLVYYDDQSNPAQVPGIYTKLLDIDKVDLVVSGYGTNVIAAAMPIVMQHEATIVGIFGLAVNSQFKYDRFFQIQPNGPDARMDLPGGFFDVAMTLQPKPLTVAIVRADSEFPQTAADGAREWSKQLDLKVVYDRAYPPGTVDFSSIIRSIQAAKPEIVFVASFPPETVGMLQSIREIGFSARLFGGGMVGPQYGTIKQQLGALLNGVVTFEVYAPAETVHFAGIEAFLARYQPKAAAAGVDPLGYYIPPYAFAALEILGAAAEATHGFDQKKIAEYIHGQIHHTVVGDIRFNAEGEWEKSRTLQVQYQNIVGNDIDQFKRPGTHTILWPKEYKSGDLRSPFAPVTR